MDFNWLPLALEVFYEILHCGEVRIILHPNCLLCANKKGSKVNAKANRTWISNFRRLHHRQLWILIHKWFVNHKMRKIVVEGSTSLKNVGFVKVEKRGWLLLETDHLWGLHVNSCVLTLSELLSSFSANLDDGFEYCPPTGPLPTTKIIWINRCLDKETRLDEDRFSICMTQKLASKEKKENLFMKKSIFETNPPQPNSIYNVTLFLFWQLYDEKSVKLAFWSRYEDTHTIGGIRQKLGSPIVWKLAVIWHFMIWGWHRCTMRYVCHTAGCRVLFSIEQKKVTQQQADYYKSFHFSSKSTFFIFLPRKKKTHKTCLLSLFF